VYKYTTYTVGGFGRILNDGLSSMIYKLPYLPECKVTLMVDDPPYKTCLPKENVFIQSKTTPCK